MTRKPEELLVPTRPGRRHQLSASLAFLPILVVSALLAAPSASAQGAARGVLPSGSAPASGSKIDLAKLRKQAEAARTELERGTKKWEEGKARLKDARERLERTQRHMERADARLEQLREPVAAIARAAYQTPELSSIAGILGSGQPRDTMRAAVDLSQVNSRNQALIREAKRLRQQQAQLARSAQELTRTTAAETKRLEGVKRELQEKSAKATDELVGALQRLGLRVSRDGRLTLDCDPDQASAAEGYPNGLIPTEALCPLPQSGEYLRADAAVAFVKLDDAYVSDFGEPICVTDSYRSLAEQQSVYYRKPGLAAIPGTSNHGLGLAVDLCGGIERYGSVQYDWMMDNAPRFGWVHPDWADQGGSRPEPWHWEYGDRS